MKHSLIFSGFSLCILSVSCKPSEPTAEKSSCCHEPASHEEKAVSTPGELATLAEAIKEIHFRSVSIDSYSAVDVSLADAVKPLEKKYNDQIGGFDSKLKLKFVVHGADEQKLTLVVKNMDLYHVLDILCIQSQYSYLINEETMEILFLPITD